MSTTPKFEQRDPAALLGFLERVCESKASYPSLFIALRAKHTVTTRGAGPAVKAVAGCKPYRCQFCGEFHLGHDRRQTVGAGR
jgi:hypothetical protein